MTTTRTAPRLTLLHVDTRAAVGERAPEYTPAISCAALPAGVHVCPWTAADGSVEVVLVDRLGRRVGSVTCPADVDRLDRVEQLLEEIALVIDGRPPITLA